MSTPTEPFRLFSLPLELREAIYEHTIGVDDHKLETYIYSKCTPRSILSLVSKQGGSEVADLIKRHKRPCRHTHFRFTLWDPRISIDEAKKHLSFGTNEGMRQPISRDLTNAIKLRIVCINTGSDNPSAVIAKFRPNERESDLDVSGASADCYVRVRRRFGRILLSRDADAWAEGRKAADVQELLIQLRIALHRLL